MILFPEGIRDALIRTGHSFCVPGDISIDNVESALNVTERDFLRTEGDPGAVGYTIKEAVQLTRSVVSLYIILTN